jgi:hypothetical protein
MKRMKERRRRRRKEKKEKVTNYHVPIARIAKWGMSLNINK